MTFYLSSVIEDADLNALKADLLNKGFLRINTKLTDIHAFESFTKNFSLRFHEVGIRQSLKEKLGDGYSFRSSDESYILLGHSEGMYRPYPPPPDTCFFFCMIPPQLSGGETTFADGVQILNNLTADLKNKLIAYGVIYQSLWKPSRWKPEFGVESERSLHAILHAFPEYEYSLENGVLSLRSRMKAVQTTRTGLLAFANGILAHLPEINHPRYSGLPYYSNSTNAVYLGNGEPFSEKEVNQMIDAYDQTLIKHKWEASDILILDNMRFMHGRLNTEKKCERLIFSRFGWLN